jgi:hypothetical protein
VNIYKRREVISRNTEKRKQNEKDNKGKWHIFALTGTVGFSVILPSKLCLLNKHKSLFSPLISKKVNRSVKRMLNEE